MSAAAPLRRHEHEFEPQWGLPEPLPKGETILWQGTPDAETLACEVLHLRLIAWYFAMLAFWQLGSSLASGADRQTAFVAALWMVALGIVVGGIVSALGFLMARTTVYTITDRRVVMRIGIVLSVTFNIPLSQIASVSLARRRPGYGELALTLGAGQRIAYLHLWPHARPWHMAQPQPLLRGLAQPELAAEALVRALNPDGARESASASATPRTAVPARRSSELVAA